MDKVTYMFLTLMAKIRSIVSDIADIRKSSAAGAPTKVTKASEMTDTDKNYLYLGNESGYNSGHIYYFVEGVLTDGGAYGGVNVDATLTQSGQAADAKVTGDKIAEVKEDLSAIQTATAGDAGKALKAKTVTNGKVTEWEFGEAGDTSIIATDYSATSTYAVGDYCTYENGLYRCTTAIETAEAWTAEHWEAVTVGSELTQNNTRLDMLVTMQAIEPEPVPDSVQCFNPEDVERVQQLNGYKRTYVSKIDISRDGYYYGNPYSGDSPLNAIANVTFWNEYDERITLTKPNGDTITFLATIYVGPNTNNKISVEENGYRIKTIVRGDQISNNLSCSSKVSYMKCYYDTDDAYDNLAKGITYGASYDAYIPYAGSAPDAPTEYEYAYNLDMVRYIQEYMQNHGTGVSNRIYDVTYPENANSEFVNAVKYYHNRAEREFNNIIRIGTFNKFISRGSGNWGVIKQELADHSIDICGFQESPAIVTDGQVTNQIGQYMQGWQFTDYAAQDTSVGQAIVSHWDVTETNIYTILARQEGDRTCIHAVINLYPYKWYSNVIDNVATLSVYSYHGMSQNGNVNGVSKTSYEIRMMEIQGLLDIIAQDTSDFIVVVGDTNCFETGFDPQTGTHAEWEAFRTAGYIPVLAGYESTVTADIAASHFALAGNGKVYCDACYDQIFIGSNITAKGYTVVDSNLYPTTTESGTPVSDHCLVYADLEFDFDAVMQTKLSEAIANSQS